MHATLTYRYAEAPVAAPSAGELTLDDPDPSVAAHVLASVTTLTGSACAPLWVGLEVGNTIEVADFGSTFNVQQWRVAGAVTLAAGVVTVPAAWIFGGGAPTDGGTVTVQLDAQHVPALAAPPTVDDVAEYLTITASQRSAAIDAMLDEDATAALDYELARADYGLLVADGASPPGTLPVDFAHAVLMRAAALYRRRNSVNGFDGFVDLGTVPVRASDPDIERLVDRWRAWSWA